jgi:hypothetical protein
MKKVVIAGSSSLKEKSEYWKKFWENKGYWVTNYPLPIPDETFFEEYPNVHKEFFKNITETDILFIMNEDKNGITGYIGAESFAELCFGVSNNLLYGKKIEILLLKMPDSKVQSYDEIQLWLKLGWIKIFV